MAIDENISETLYIFIICQVLLYRWLHICESISSEQVIYDNVVTLHFARFIYFSNEWRYRIVRIAGSRSKRAMMDRGRASSATIAIDFRIS